MRGAGNTVTFAATRQLAADEDLTIGVRIPKGAITEPLPMLVAKPRGIDRWFERSPIHLGATALALVAGLWALWSLWSKRGRDRSDGRSPTIVAEYEPPERLRPAQVGLLLDERADTKDLTATIVDLAVRGHLTIEEIPKEGLFAKDNWRLTKQRDGEGLVPYETTLLGGIFAKGTTVTLSELKGSMATTLARAQRQLYEDSVVQGWFPRDPDRARGLWQSAGSRSS